MKLALNGGEKTRTKPFISWPVFDNRETEALTKVCKSGKWWRFAFSEGLELNEKEEGDDRAQVVLFQEEFAKYQGGTYGLSCANGTAALELILKSLGIGAGDEVIIPSYTFVSTATSVLQVNAVPIFADIDPETYNIDIERAEQAITPRTKAIIPVHFFGQPADMDKIIDLAKKHNLFVVEDAAHAHGSEWKGKRVGALGDAGAFSFQASKNITAGEGGLILTNNKKIAGLCDSYIWLGREPGRPWYEFHRLGWNYRITEFQGAILRVQLSRLNEQIARRKENVEYFFSLLQQIDGLVPVKVLDKVTRHSWHIIGLKYDPNVWGVEKEQFKNALISEGICVTGDYSFPLYKNPMFLNMNFGKDGCPVKCPRYKNTLNYADFEATNPVAENACKNEAIWLEQRMFLGGKEDIDDIIKAIKKIQANLNELK
jgi:dTDP-4-amino-4,6-dideoxygalactose transaminase